MFTTKMGFAIFVAAVVGIFAFCFWPSASNSSDVKTPVNLSGSWHQTTNDAPAIMTAEIDGDHIQILMSSDLANGILYWDGTFDTQGNSSNKFQIVSTADEKALSQATTKTFTYKNGELDFVFTMLKKNYTIRMSRGE